MQVQDDEVEDWNWGRTASKGKNKTYVLLYALSALITLACRSLQLIPNLFKNSDII